MNDTPNLADVWDSLLRAVGTEPRPAREIMGASGIVHRPLALGVDDGSNRFVAITDEPTARGAAMMQVDLSATMPGVRVAVARVIPFDLQIIADLLIKQFGGLGSLITTMMAAQERAKAEGTDAAEIFNAQFGGMQVIASNIGTIRKVPIGYLNAFLQLIDQLRVVEIAGAIEAVQESDNVDAAHRFFERFKFEKLAATDPIAADRSAGVCPLLLPSFTETDIDTLQKNGAIEDAQEILKSKRIYQYFYPGIDDLALGLVDRGVSERSEIARMASASPDLGHPHGENEIVESSRDVMEVIDELQGRGLTVEGEVGIEMGPSGVTRRTSVKFKPSEGVTSKVLNRCSLNVNINANVSASVADLIGKGLI